MRSQATLRQYYTSFGSVLGAIAGIALIPALLANLLPDDIKPFVFPPLGVIEPPARIATVLMGLGVTFIVYYVSLEENLRFKRIASVSLIALISMFFYLVCFSRFVREINVSSKGTTVAVSVGFEKTQFANSTFGAAGDWEMLEARGTDEEQIWKLWSGRSIITARLGLIVGYWGFLFSFIAALSLGIAYQADDKAISKKSSNTST